MAALLLWTAAALAAPPPFLFQVPEDGAPGESAGRIQFPQGATPDPNPPGHVFVSDATNHRITEFDPWGLFVKSWGYGVIAGAEGAELEELQACTEETGCQKGAAGKEAGQLDFPEAIAVDSAGIVYVIEAIHKRVLKFDPSPGGEEDEVELVGEFGEEGEGEGQFSGGKFAYTKRMAICQADDRVFIGEGKRVQIFDSEGNFEESIAMPEEKNARAIALDGACNLYVAFSGQEEVQKLKGSSPTEVLEPVFAPESPEDNPEALAVDGADNLYVVLGPTGGGEPWRVQKYDEEGNCLTCGETGEGAEPGFDRVSDKSQLFGLGATGACHPEGKAENAYLAHFTASTPLSYLRGYGIPDPLICPPPKRPPEITAQFAVSVEAEAAKIRAKINPQYWSGEVGTTSYYAEYATAACVEAEGWESPCVSTTATPPGVALGGEATNSAVPTPVLVLEGLEAETTYRYRFVAVSEGGGPTIGPETTFITYRKPEIPPCPENKAFRSGPSSQLPDCRAYELVSPLDKAGGDIVPQNEFATILPAVLSQSAGDGERVAYGSYRSFGDAESAPQTSQYVARREAGVGWLSHGVSPPRSRSFFAVGVNFDNEIRHFSEDLCTAIVQSFADPPLAEDAPEGFTNLYARLDQDCGGAPDWRAFNTALPETIEEIDPKLGFRVELQGVSADEETAVFRANDVLGEGGSEGKFQLYGSRLGAGEVEEELICILPGGAPHEDECTAGGSTGSVTQMANREANLTGALSADGERVYWTATGSGAAPIYLNENPFGEGTECTGEGAPCRIAVSKAAEIEEATTGSQFQAAAKDGSRALFTTGGCLYEYVREGEETNLIACEVVGAPLGSSEDAARVYFASREALGGENPEGDVAVAEERNVYLHEAGAEDVRLVGTLAPSDPGGGSIHSPLAQQPRFHTARVSPDGLSLAFPSAASLTGYDNHEQGGEEEPLPEVFLYDADGGEGEEGELVCASCNPSGARPRGGEPQEGREEIRGAARLPVFQNALYGSRLISQGGDRLFFLAFDALRPTDTNQREDLYQWEAAGEGECELESPTYSPLNEGCVDLISSGQAPLDVHFLDSSADGSDVFFTTVASLLPQDYGLVDVYDARANGGLPTPPPPLPGCEGETCQNPAPAPEYNTTAAEDYRGPGNLKPKKKKAKKKRCAKGKHEVRRKGKVRCVKNRARHKRHARHHRLAKAKRVSPR